MTGHNEYMKLELAKNYITDHLYPEELLAQLAEEASELAHAALKLRRVLDGENPTPVDRQTAVAALKEEVADVTLLVNILRLDSDPGEIRAIMDHKLLRWQARLMERE